MNLYFQNYPKKQKTSFRRLPLSKWEYIQKNISIKKYAHQKYNE